MPQSRLRLCRSLLFLPASNPRAVAKARALDADMVILDCEDAVKDAEKDEARQAAVEALAAGSGERLAAVRINAVGSPFFGQDVVAIRDSKADLVVLPKVESPDQVRNTANLILKPVVAMIETAAGVLHAAAIAPAAAGLIAGTNDLAADLGLPANGDRAGLHVSLQTILLAARAARVAAFDGVYNGLSEDAELVRQCEEGRAFGFDGKALIHPSQIEAANRIFGPSEAEVEAARRLIDAASGGAERHEGRMIESLHVEQARFILAKARR